MTKACQKKLFKQLVLFTLYMCFSYLAYKLLFKKYFVLTKTGVNPKERYLSGRDINEKGTKALLSLSLKSKSNRRSSSITRDQSFTNEEATNNANGVNIIPNTFARRKPETVAVNIKLQTGVSETRKTTPNSLNRTPTTYYFTKQVTNKKKLNTITPYMITHKGDEAYKSRERKKENKILLTLFTTWEEEDNKYLCRNNTIRNWNLLGPLVKRILFTNKKNLAFRVQQLGWNVLPVTNTGTTGVPVLKTMFKQAISAVNSSFYAYANGDIIFTSDFIQTLHAIEKDGIYKFEDLLVIGQRTDVCFVSKPESVNYKKLIYAAKNRGSSLRSPYKTDYFIVKRGYPWESFPELVIGRPYVDSYLVADAASRGHVVDITPTSLAVHQITKTGKAGTDEGLTHPDKDYNINLLKGYKYETGHIYMSSFVTNFEMNRNIKVRLIDNYRSPYIDDGQFVC